MANFELMLLLSAVHKGWIPRQLNQDVCLPFYVLCVSQLDSNSFSIFFINPVRCSLV